MEQRPHQPEDKYIIRFPDGMRPSIAEAARANNRSMNAEIVARLQASFEGSGADDAEVLMEMARDLFATRQMAVILRHQVQAMAIELSKRGCPKDLLSGPREALSATEFIEPQTAKTKLNALKDLIDKLWGAPIPRKELRSLMLPKR